MQASRKIRDGAASGACKRGGGLVADQLIDGAGADVPKLTDEIVAFILKCFEEKARIRYAYETTAREFPTAGLTEAQVKAVAKVHDIQMERGPEKGTFTGGGRTKGQKDSKPRKARPSVREDVLRLYDAAQGKRSASSIAAALGITRAAASKWITRERKATP